MRCCRACTPGEAPRRCTGSTNRCMASWRALQALHRCSPGLAQLCSLDTCVSTPEMRHRMARGCTGGRPCMRACRALQARPRGAGGPQRGRLAGAHPAGRRAVPGCVRAMRVCGASGTSARLYQGRYRIGRCSTAVRGICTDASCSVLLGALVSLCPVPPASIPAGQQACGMAAAAAFTRCSR